MTPHNLLRLPLGSHLGHHRLLRLRLRLLLLLMINIPSYYLLRLLLRIVLPLRWNTIIIPLLLRHLLRHLLWLLLGIPIRLLPLLLRWQRLLLLGVSILLLLRLLLVLILLLLTLICLSNRMSWEISACAWLSILRTIIRTHALRRTQVAHPARRRARVLGHQRTSSNGVCVPRHGSHGAGAIRGGRVIPLERVSNDLLLHHRGLLLDCCLLLGRWQRLSPSQLLILLAVPPETDGETDDEDDCNAGARADACLGGGGEAATAARVGDGVAHGPDDVDDGGGGFVFGRGVL